MGSEVSPGKRTRLKNNDCPTLLLHKDRSYLAACEQPVVAGRFAPGYNAADHSLVALCEAPHNKRMQQTIPPANKFASGLAPDPQRWGR